MSKKLFPGVTVLALVMLMVAASVQADVTKFEVTDSKNHLLNDSQIGKLNDWCSIDVSYCAPDATGSGSIYGSVVFTFNVNENYVAFDKDGMKFQRVFLGKIVDDVLQHEPGNGYTPPVNITGDYFDVLSWNFGNVKDGITGSYSVTLELTTDWEYFANAMNAGEIAIIGHLQSLEGLNNIKSVKDVVFTARGDGSGDNVPTTPEPATLLILGLATLGTGFAARRRSR